jgi:hypothetical protein
MIVADNKSKKVVQSHDFEAVTCTIDAEDMRYVASLLRNNYSNTQLAVIREISANAIDANVEANCSKKIEITLPSKMNPNFCVRDFGGGLSQEDVFGLYSKYGKSTKRNSNDYVGFFGIGRFSPLAYGDNFTCVSFHGGTKSSYNVYVDEHDDTKIVKLFSEPSNEPTGLEIQVAISEQDIDNFRDSCKKFFKHFPDKDMPKFLGADDKFIKRDKILLESKKDDWFFIESENSSYYYRHNGQSHVIMGRVAYPLDSNAIDVKNYVTDENQIKVIENLLQEPNFYLRVPLGCVKLHHSREALEYNKPTQKFVVQLMIEVVKEIQELAQEKLADSEDLFEAKANYARIVNSLPDTLRRAFENSFTWQGLPITSFAFDRPYGMVDDLIITHTEKVGDRDARNGFRVRSSKTNRVCCRSNTIFLLQDIESTHGNNLRARTLFNEDDELESVYFIHAKTDSAQSVIDNEWHFGRIANKHKKFVSNVAKEKPQIGVRKGQGSRANIALFEMKLDANSYWRNIDYWSNVKEDIASLQESDDQVGLIDGKFVYVPIKSYKIDDEQYDLKSICSRANKIRKLAQDNSQEKSFRLFGVRSGDVSNLDKSSWISFFDFMADAYKKYLLDNKAQAKKAYNYVVSRQDSELNSAISVARYDIGRLFNNKQLDLSKLSQNHLLRQSKENFNTIVNEDYCSTCCAYISFLKDKGESEWLEFNLDNGFSAKQFKQDIDTIKSSYPMLVHVADSVRYSNVDQQIFDDIINYINLCDKK